MDHGMVNIRTDVKVGRGMVGCRFGAAPDRTRGGTPEGAQCASRWRRTATTRLRRGRRHTARATPPRYQPARGVRKLPRTCALELREMSRDCFES